MNDVLYVATLLGGVILLLGDQVLVVQRGQARMLPLGVVDRESPAAILELVLDSKLLERECESGL